ncbi:MAG: hypothetical protein ACOY30_05340 [Bacillota bacterium]
MSVWKRMMEDFFGPLNTPLFGAGFRKEGVEINRHPRLISFDGHSVYFFGLKEKEAKELLDGVTMLNGYTGWLAYILQEVFFDERIAGDLYDEIFDGLDSGVINKPARLSSESIFQWVERVAPEVEKIKSRLESFLPDGGAMH